MKNQAIAKYLQLCMLVWICTLIFTGCASKNEAPATIAMDTAPSPESAPNASPSDAQKASSDDGGAAEGEAAISSGADNTTIENNLNSKGEPRQKKDAPDTPAEVRMIYTANVNMQVQNIEETSKEIKLLLKQTGAYYTTERFTGGEQMTKQFTLRVPQANFEPLIEKLEKLAKYVDYKQVSGSDITKEYYDYEIRLKSKRKTLEQYYEILKRSGQISDVLQVQSHIGSLESQIESIEGQLRFWDKQLQYSTIELSIYTARPLISGGSPQSSFGHQIADAFLSGGRGAMQLFLVFLNLWPLWLIAGLGYWAFKRYKRNKINTAKINTTEINASSPK